MLYHPPFTAFYKYSQKYIYIFIIGIWRDPTMAVVTHWLLDQVIEYVKTSSDTLWTNVDTGINVLSLLEQTPLQLRSLSFALCPMFVSSMEQFTSSWLFLSNSEKS
jgi:hypothetical protein